MSEQRRTVHPPTLCWNCEKAIGTCSWSKDLIPVEGWNAVPTSYIASDKRLIESFMVIECPEFKADACFNGTKRLSELDKLPKKKRKYGSLSKE